MPYLDMPDMVVEYHPFSDTAIGYSFLGRDFVTLGQKMTLEPYVPHGQISLHSAWGLEPYTRNAQEQPDRMSAVRA